MAAETVENLTQKMAKTQPDRPQTVDFDRLLHKMQNNNHHVVPVGILIVLFTLYLTVATLQHNFEYFFDKATAQEIQQRQQTDEHMLKEKRPPKAILQPMHEQMLCYKMEIFQNAELEHVASAPELMPPNENAENQNIRKQTKSKRTTRRAAQNGKSNGNGKGKGNGNGNGNSHGKANNKTNKLKAVKSADAKKKEAQKKNSTAEPIIYLFALIFIYLLLKAASDINQHYKSQNKGDKRLRRCSLQSYAQAHKQDRRASKGILSKNLPKP